MKQFTIIEEKWARGGNGGNPALLNKEGNKCCLGFFCSSPWVPDKSLLDQGLPSIIVETPNDIRELFRENAELDDEPWGSLEETIAYVNDDTAILDCDRKSKLAPLFAKLGYEIQYV